MQETIPDYNLFMVCRTPNPDAYRSLPESFVFDLCRSEELETWKSFPFDDENTAQEQQAYMTSFFKQVYGAQKELFFSRCLFVRNAAGEAVATCFLWKAYQKVNTLHWLKVKKDYEGLGIGRALLTKLLEGNTDFPIVLHTQPDSFRAIKLYTDFGFQLITDDGIGKRENHLYASLPILKKHLPESAYQKLSFASAPSELLEAAAMSDVSEF